MASPTWLSSGSFDTALQIWNLSTRQRVSQIAWSFNAPFAVPALSAQGDLAYGFELSPQGNNEASFSGLRFESLVDTGLSSILSPPPITNAVALANDGQTLAVAYLTTQSEWRISLLDRLSNVTKADFSIDARPTTNLFFSPDGTQIAVLRTDTFGGTGRDFSVWRVSDGQMLFEPDDHTQAPRGMAFSPDGTLLVLIGDGGTDAVGIEVYDARRWSRTRGLRCRDRGSFQTSRRCGIHLAVLPSGWAENGRNAGSRGRPKTSLSDRKLKRFAALAQW